MSCRYIYHQLYHCIFVIESICFQTVLNYDILCRIFRCKMKIVFLKLFLVASYSRRKPQLQFLASMIGIHICNGMAIAEFGSSLVLSVETKIYNIFRTRISDNFLSSDMPTKRLSDLTNSVIVPLIAYVNVNRRSNEANLQLFCTNGRPRRTVC